MHRHNTSTRVSPDTEEGASGHMRNTRPLLATVPLNRDSRELERPDSTRDRLGAMLTCGRESTLSFIAGSPGVGVRLRRSHRRRRLFFRGSCQHARSTPSAGSGAGHRRIVVVAPVAAVRVPVVPFALAQSSVRWRRRGRCSAREPSPSAEQRDGRALRGRPSADSAAADPAGLRQHLRNVGDSGSAR